MNRMNTWFGVKNGITLVKLIGVKEPIERNIDWRVRGSALYADLKGKIYPFTVYALEQEGLLEYLDKIVRIEVKAVDALWCRLNLYLTVPQEPEKKSPKAKEIPKNSSKSKKNKNEQKIAEIFKMLVIPDSLQSGDKNSDDVQKPTTKPKPRFEDKVERKYEVQKPFGNFVVFGGVGETHVEVMNSLIAEITPNETVKLPDKEVSIDKYNWVISAKLYEK